MEHIPGPDFPTGGIICGKTAIWKGYETGRSTVVVRSKTTIEERKGDRYRIIVNDIPYQQSRDAVHKKIADAANEGRIPGIAGVRDESDLKEPVRLVIDLKKDADPDIVLNQLYKFTPLQDSFSIILLALVDGKPRTLSLKEMLQEFMRHRVTVIRRRTQFLLARARRRKHTVQGLLLAHANIDEVIRVIRASQVAGRGQRTADGRSRRRPPCCSGRWATMGFAQFQQERGIAEEYSLTPVQADAILKMTLGQLVNLEQEKLVDEHTKLLEQIDEYLAILADEARIYPIIREDCEELARKHGDARRTRAQRRRDRRGRYRGPHRRRDDGRLDLAQRLHQAHAGQRLPGPAPRRQGHQGRARPTKTIRSSTCSSPARTTTCCSSPPRARCTGRRFIPEGAGPMDT